MVLGLLPLSPPIIFAFRTNYSPYNETLSMKGNIMTKRKLANLWFAREAVIEEQGNLFAEIKALSKDPDKTGQLLCRVTGSAVDYNNLSIDVQHALFKGAAPFWKRLFLN